MKSYTDLSQSRILAEFLPHESADMFYTCANVVIDGIVKYCKEPILHKPLIDPETAIPCWSLSALLEVLPKKYYPIKDHETNLILGKPKDKWCALYWDTTGMQHGEETLGDNPIDAAFEMIVKLHEQKLL